jgi:hypothetical protein
VIIRKPIATAQMPPLPCAIANRPKPFAKAASGPLRPLPRPSAQILKIPLFIARDCR